MIRSLKPGEYVPEGPPRRYPSSQGYIRLRWTVATGQQVETYEHRVFNGRITEAEEVHHKNHDRTDNRTENLEPLTSAEHGAAHRKYDHDLMVELYQSGLTTTQVATRLGTDAVRVLRVLEKAGVPRRSVAEQLRRDLDEDRIRDLHAQGVRARAIAKELGCSSFVIDQRFRELGLPPFKTGRPPKVAS